MKTHACSCHTQLDQLATGSNIHTQLISAHAVSLINTITEPGYTVAVLRSPLVAKAARAQISSQYQQH